MYGCQFLSLFSKFGFAIIFLRGFVLLRIMLRLKVWLMRFEPSFRVFSVTSGWNSLWLFVQWTGNFLDWCHRAVFVMIFCVNVKLKFLAAFSCRDECSFDFQCYHQVIWFLLWRCLLLRIMLVTMWCSVKWFQIRFLCRSNIHSATWAKGIRDEMEYCYQ